MSELDLDAATPGSVPGDGPGPSPAEGQPAAGRGGEAVDTALAPTIEPPRTARKAAIAVGVVLAALIALLAFSGGDEAASRSALLGNRVPEVTGTDLNGEAFSVDDLRGSWVVVNFFATWCPPCVAEHPELVAVDEWGRARGDVQLVSVVFNEPDDEPVRRFFAERGGDWPVVQGTTAAIDFQVSQIPETFIVTPNGQVIAHIPGETTAAEITALIEAAEGADG